MGHLLQDIHTKHYLAKYVKYFLIEKKVSRLHDREALHTSFEFWKSLLEVRARICRRLQSPGIDSEESSPPAYVTWRAGTGCSYGTVTFFIQTFFIRDKVYT